MLRVAASKVYSMRPSDAHIVAQQLCNGCQHCLVAMRMDASGSISTVLLTSGPNGFAVARWGSDNVVETDCPNLMLKITSTSALKRQKGQGQHV